MQTKKSSVKSTNYFRRPIIRNSTTQLNMTTVEQPAKLYCIVSFHNNNAAQSNTISTYKWYFICSQNVIFKYKNKTFYGCGQIFVENRCIFCMLLKHLFERTA